MSDAISAKYEATVLTGIENVAQDEIAQKLNVNGTVHQGRVWFETDKPVEQILSLKSICNLYVIIHDVTLDPKELPSNPESLEELLMKVGEQCDWTTGLKIWSQVSKFDCSLDKLLKKDEELRSVQPKFRVSCNRHGTEHKFTSPEVCSTLGHVIDTKYGWPIKMKDYDLEVLATFSDCHLYIGLTLTTKTLDCRNIVETGYTTLRAATCYALLRLANIKCGDIVIDPMAGSGAIPVENCSVQNDEWKSYTIAGELIDIPTQKCRVNLDAFKGKSSYDLLQFDVTNLPLKGNSVDVIVSDLPFGRRHGSRKKNRILYPALFKEMARVARQGSARAVLLTEDYKSMLLAYDQNRSYWEMRSSCFVKIGNLNCKIFVFDRRNRMFGPRVDTTA